MKLNKPKTLKMKYFVDCFDYYHLSLMIAIALFLIWELQIGYWHIYKDVHLSNIYAKTKNKRTSQEKLAYLSSLQIWN